MHWQLLSCPRTRPRSQLWLSQVKLKRRYFRHRLQRHAIQQLHMIHKAAKFSLFTTLVTLIGPNHPQQFMKQERLPMSRRKLLPVMWTKWRSLQNSASFQCSSMSRNTIYTDIYVPSYLERILAMKNAISMENIIQFWPSVQRQQFVCKCLYGH